MDIVVLILATWRISHLFSREDGPWLVFTHMRTWKLTGSLFDCFWCVSVWVATATSLIAHFVGIWPLVPFALSGIVVGIEVGYGASQTAHHD